MVELVFRDRREGASSREGGRSPLFLEVSSRTSSPPNAGWTELNTDDEFFVIFLALMSRIVSCKIICCCTAWCRGAREPPTCLFFGFPSGRLGPEVTRVTVRVDCESRQGLSRLYDGVLCLA